MGTPPDAEDLEVAMINDSYEEAQKQKRLYEGGGLKEAFYSHPNPLTSPPSTSAQLHHHAPLARAPVREWVR